MKRLFLIAVLLLLPRLAHAQTVVQSAEWDFLNSTTAALSGFTYTSQVNTGAVVLVTPTCANASVNVHCSYPVTPALKSGDTVTLTIFNAGGVANALKTTFAPGAVIATSGFTITIKITVP